jgi:phytoene dehydrogenase-like protein
MSAADLLDEWFESDALKGLLAGAGILHLAQGPRSGGTAFNLLHHHVGSPPGVFRPALSNVRSALLRRGEGDVRHASAATRPPHASNLATGA